MAWEDPMAAKPTPRPWRVFNVAGVIEIQDAKGEPVVFWQGFDRTERSHATHLANARLIVAAVNATTVEKINLTDEQRKLLTVSGPVSIPGVEGRTK
jgi:hypothetical protein